MARVTVIAILIVVVMIGVIVLGIRNARRFECEACVTFLGRTECRTASGPTEKDAIRTAVDHACAFLASGMTDSIACTTRSPVTSRCDAP